MATPSWFKLRTMPPLASSRVTYVRVWRLCRWWARICRVEVEAACMFATGESQLGAKPYPEILFARKGKPGVTELVRVMRNEVLRNEAMRNGVIQDERIQGQSTKAGLRALPSIPGRPL